MLRASDEGDKSKDDSIDVIALGGGAMKVDVTIRFSIEQSEADELFRKAGSLDLVKERFVRPEAREVIRDVFGAYSAEAGYSTARAEIGAKVTDVLRERLVPLGILVDSVNIRDVAPDKQQLDAINAILAARNDAKKAQEEQTKLVTQAETRRQVAEKDALEIQIRADATATANRTIAESLTEELLALRKAEICADAIKQTKVAVVYGCEAASAGAGNSDSGNAATVIVDARKG